MLTLFTQEQAREMDLAEARREARAEGMTLGMTRGKEAQARDTAMNFHSMGLDAEAIAKGINYPVRTVELWINEHRN